MLWEGMLPLRFVDDLAGAIYDIIKVYFKVVCLFVCRYGNCGSSNVFDILAIWIISVIIFNEQVRFFKSQGSLFAYLSNKAV